MGACIFTRDYLTSWPAVIIPLRMESIFGRSWFVPPEKSGQRLASIACRYPMDIIPFTVTGYKGWYPGFFQLQGQPHLSEVEVQSIEKVKIAGWWNSSYPLRSTRTNWLSPDPVSLMGRLAIFATFLMAAWVMGVHLSCCRPSIPPKWSRHTAIGRASGGKCIVQSHLWLFEYVVWDFWMYAWSGTTRPALCQMAKSAVSGDWYSICRCPYQCRNGFHLMLNRRRQWQVASSTEFQTY